MNGSHTLTKLSHEMVTLIVTSSYNATKLDYKNGIRNIMMMLMSRGLLSKKIGSDINFSYKSQYIHIKQLELDK